MPMIEVVLAGCSKSKRDGVHRACDLYDESPIYRKRRRFARDRDAHFGILSAKYGYLRPWDAIPTYDVHIDARTRVWAAFVFRDLVCDLDHYDADQVTILAGRKYVEPLVPPLEPRGYDVVDWNHGRLPGERMAALDEAVTPGAQQALPPATAGGQKRQQDTEVTIDAQPPAQTTLSDIS